MVIRQSGLPGITMHYKKRVDSKGPEKAYSLHNVSSTTKRTIRDNEIAPDTSSKTLAILPRIFPVSQSKEVS